MPRHTDAIDIDNVIWTDHSSIFIDHCADVTENQIYQPEGHPLGKMRFAVQGFCFGRSPPDLKPEAVTYREIEPPDRRHLEPRVTIGFRWLLASPNEFRQTTECSLLGIAWRSRGLDLDERRHN